MTRRWRLMTGPEAEQCGLGAALGCLVAAAITVVVVAVGLAIWWLWPSDTNTVCMASQSINMDGTATVTPIECFDVDADGRIVARP